MSVVFGDRGWRRCRPARVGGCLAALTVALLVPVSCSTEEARRVEGGTPVADGPNDPNEPFAIGDTIEIGDFRLVVHGLTDPYVGSSTETSASSDDRWVAVDVELINLEDEPVEVSGWALFEIQDSTHQDYRVVDPEDDTPSIDGEIPAGGSRRGTLVFEVPREVSGFRLFFAGDVFASGNATVALS